MLIYFVKWEQIMLRNLFYAIFAVGVLFNSIEATPSLISSQEKSCEKFVQVPGAELYCLKMGSGKPIIVLHGGAGFLTHDYLLPHLARLAENHLVIFYDQRGLGRSSGEINQEQINLKTYLQDIEAIRTSFGLDKVTLLGHSWGGFLMMHYAFIHPEAIDSLIFVSSMPCNSDDLGLFLKELPKRTAPYEAELKRIQSSELYASGDSKMVEAYNTINFQTYMYCPDNIKKINLWMPQKAAYNGLKIWDIFKDQIFMKPYDLTHQLNTITCPTLIIHGDVDPIPFVTAEHISAAIPKSQFVKINQCGHFPFVEQPEAFFNAIKNFHH